MGFPEFNFTYKTTSYSSLIEFFQLVQFLELGFDIICRYYICSVSVFVVRFVFVELLLLPTKLVK